MGILVSGSAFSLSQACKSSSPSTSTSPPSVRIDGGWSSWGECSGAALFGCYHRKQTRTCTNPKPANGGSSCEGSNEKSCPDTPSWWCHYTPLGGIDKEIIG